MDWIRYIILTILLLLSLWVAYHKYMSQKSKFWKNQPVTRKGMNDKIMIGQILDNPLSDQHRDLIKSRNIDPVDHKSWNSFVELIKEILSLHSIYYCALKNARVFHYL